MKKLLTVVATSAVLAGCASTKSVIKNMDKTSKYGQMSVSYCVNIGKGLNGNGMQETAFEAYGAKTELECLLKMAKGDERKFKKSIDYYFESHLYKPDNVSAMLKPHKIRLDKVVLAADLEKEKEKLAKVKMHCPNYVEETMQGSVVIGMSTKCVYLTIGKPDTENHTVTKGSYSVQMVYGTLYVYTDNNVVSAIQY